MNNSRLTQVMRAFNSNLVKKEISDFENHWMTFGENNEYEVSVAGDFETRQSAYFLLYKNYTEKEYIQPNSYKLWYSIHDSNKSTFTVVVKKGVKVVGAVTVNFEDVIDLPARQIFQEELQHIRKQGHNVCEITSLAIDKKVTNANEILIKLFNYAYLVSKEIKDCTGFIITVNPKHEAFYRRKLLFSQLGNIKDYKKVGGAPAAFLFLNFNKVTNTINDIKYKETTSRESSRSLYVSFINSKELIEKIRREFTSNFKPMNKREINIFFYDNIEKWDSLKSHEQNIIHQRMKSHSINNSGTIL